MSKRPLPKLPQFCLPKRPHYFVRIKITLPKHGTATIAIVDNIGHPMGQLHVVYSTGTRIPDPLFPHVVPPAIMVWIFVWKYIFEPFIHILQHFVLQLSRSTNFCF